MRQSIILCVVFALGSAFTSTAFTQINRSVSILFQGVTESKTYSGDGAINQTVADSISTQNASAQQTSSVSGDDISVAGTVSFGITSGNPENNVQTSTQCSVTFTLFSPAMFTLTEQSSLENDPQGSDGEVGCFGAVLVSGAGPILSSTPSLIPIIPVLFNQEVVDRSTRPNLTYNGTLAPGTYTYEIGAGGNGSDLEGGSLTFSSDFQLAPTPEPASLSLLGMGALAMLRKRRGAWHGRLVASSVEILDTVSPRVPVGRSWGGV